ncbi:MAG: hypothetical protein JRE23_03255 [Deltaproteobacteria bacterium]|nr:hypothetical protein [Deltaproteobacteria bacterium]
MNRSKKRLMWVQEDKPLELPGTLPAVLSKHEYICEGCKRIATVQDSDLYECSVYAFVPPYYIRQGCCYFNRPETKTKKKITKGQQKQGRNR